MSRTRANPNTSLTKGKILDNVIDDVVIGHNPYIGIAGKDDLF